MGNIFLLPHARTNWQHVFTRGPGVMNRSIPLPARQIVGGQQVRQRHGLYPRPPAGLRRLGVASPALARLSGAELKPGPGVTENAALEAYIRSSVATTCLPVKVPAGVAASIKCSNPQPASPYKEI